MNEETTVSTEEKFDVSDVNALFIRSWESSSSVAEVAEKTGKKITTCSTTASNFRTKYGIPLKRMPKGPGGGGSVNPEAMRALFDSIPTKNLSTPHQEGRENLAKDRKEREAV